MTNTGWSMSCKITVRWMSRELIDMLRLILVMAWCRRKQSITWANVGPDLCRHLTSPGHNEFNQYPQHQVHVSSCRTPRRYGRSWTYLFLEMWTGTQFAWVVCLMWILCSLHDCYIHSKQCLSSWLRLCYVKKIRNLSTWRLCLFRWLLGNNQFLHAVGI